MARKTKSAKSTKSTKNGKSTKSTKSTKSGKSTKSTKSGKTERKRVKFELETSAGSEVYVAGTFNGWDASKHRLKMKDGVFSKTLLVPKGRHEYKFVVDNVWCVDPRCPEWVPNDKGSLNSVIRVN